MILTKQSASGDYVAYADLSIPVFELRHIVHDSLYDVVACYVGRPNYNSMSLVKRLFRNIKLQ